MINMTLVMLFLVGNNLSYMLLVMLDKNIYEWMCVTIFDITHVMNVFGSDLSNDRAGAVVRLLNKAF